MQVDSLQIIQQATESYYLYRYVLGIMLFSAIAFATSLFALIRTKVTDSEVVTTMLIICIILSGSTAILTLLQLLLTPETLILQVVK